MKFTVLVSLLPLLVSFSNGVTAAPTEPLAAQIGPAIHYPFQPDLVGDVLHVSTHAYEKRLYRETFYVDLFDKNYMWVLIEDDKNGSVAITSRWEHRAMIAVGGPSFSSAAPKSSASASASRSAISNSNSSVATPRPSSASSKPAAAPSSSASAPKSSVSASAPKSSASASASKAAAAPSASSSAPKSSASASASKPASSSASAPKSSASSASASKSAAAVSSSAPKPSVSASGSASKSAAAISSSAPKPSVSASGSASKSAAAVSSSAPKPSASSASASKPAAAPASSSAPKPSASSSSATKPAVSASSSASKPSVSASASVSKAAVSSSSSAPPKASSSAPKPSASSSSAAAPAVSGSVSVGVSAADQAKFLTLHNDFRAKYSANPVVWDQTLADFALKTATSCKYGHTGGPYGENIAAGVGGGYNIDKAFASWANEDALYNFALPGYASATGHFTAIVWKGTTKVGCAAASCADGSIFTGYRANSTYVVCNYQTPGNIVSSDPLRTAEIFRTNVGPKK